MASYLGWHRKRRWWKMMPHCVTRVAGRKRRTPDRPDIEKASMIETTAELLTPDDLKIIDVDTHLSESHDLWTSRVPARLRNSVPHVVADASGNLAWLFDGGAVFSQPAGSADSVRADGSKRSLWEYTTEPPLRPGEALAASHDHLARLEMMDDQKIWAQVLYPNLLLFSQGLLVRMADRSVANRIVSIYNDAVAEIQAESGGRLFPMAVIPFWDVKAAVDEAVRAAGELDLRGVVMCSEPHSAGCADLGDTSWTPLWEACCDLRLPVNLHAGGSEGAMAAYREVWPSLDPYHRHMIGAMNVELHQVPILVNLLGSGVLDRFPDLQWVLVESGIGWIPYVLERLDFQMREPVKGEQRSSPVERFRRQVHSTFWLEEVGPGRVLDYLGIANIMFETDFPHPVCQYPTAAEFGLRALAPWGADAQRAVMQDNAAHLYRIEV